MQALFFSSCPTLKKKVNNYIKNRKAIEYPVYCSLYLHSVAVNFSMYDVLLFVEFS